MKNLLLTLGHNSSAILIEDGRVVWGYETERLTGQKSDSHFPLAVLEAKNCLKPDMVYATHWAPTGQLSDMSAKHWKPEVFDGIPVRTLAFDRSHHDTHIASAMSYAGQYFTTRRDVVGLVIDGFGTLGEHLTVYSFEHGVPKMKRRIHGYGSSLGLWYQYATAFMGMKMHEDEYKLLGYEVHCPLDMIEKVENDAGIHAAHLLDEMHASIYGSKFDPLYNLDALAAIKEQHFKHLASVCRGYGIDDPSSESGRAILAKYVQTVLENVVLWFVKNEIQAGAQHFLCSGGVFLNVKLNMRILREVPGQICVHPLAGDQGNALGLYAMDHPEFLWPQHLNWGKRYLRNTGKVDGITWEPNTELAAGLIIDRLEKVGYVNLVRRDMEFGPRALCNTTTLAIATEDNVRRINAANARNTVMPMAPVMTPDMYHSLFLDTDKVWKSEEHMIVAMMYKDHPTDVLRGVAHRYDDGLIEYFTGRPQVLDNRDPFMMDILNHFGHPLINTSFNFHGQPIAYESEHVIKNHVLQYQRDNSFETIIIPN